MPTFRRGIAALFVLAAPLCAHGGALAADPPERLSDVRIARGVVVSADDASTPTLDGVDVTWWRLAPDGSVAGRGGHTTTNGGGVYEFRDLSLGAVRMTYDFDGGNGAAPGRYLVLAPEARVCGDDPRCVHWPASTPSAGPTMLERVDLVRAGDAGKSTAMSWDEARPRSDHLVKYIETRVAAAGSEGAARGAVLDGLLHRLEALQYPLSGRVRVYAGLLASESNRPVLSARFREMGARGVPLEARSLERYGPLLYDTEAAFAGLLANDERRPPWPSVTALTEAGVPSELLAAAVRIRAVQAAREVPAGEIDAAFAEAARAIGAMTDYGLAIDRIPKLLPPEKPRDDVATPR